jgi:Lrp/AsnC family transcriptional regulator for asnA, asnC and gidA
MKLDKLNLQILKHLQDGRKSFRSIADELSVAENTVRSRINRMMDEGVMDITARADIQNLDGHTLVFIGIKLSEFNLFEKSKEIEKLRGVVSVAVVTGRFDLIMTVLLKEQFGLLEFYSQEMSRVEGVTSVESFVVYGGQGLLVPYVLDVDESEE